MAAIARWIAVMGAARALCIFFRGAGLFYHPLKFIVGN